MKILQAAIIKQESYPYLAINSEQLNKENMQLKK